MYGGRTPVPGRGMRSWARRARAAWRWHCRSPCRGARMREPFDRAAEILLHGILDRAFPAAVAEVGRNDGPIWRRAFGTLTYDAGSPNTTNETVFDLASLTKVLATTTLAMRAIDDELLTVGDLVRSRLSEWRGADRESITIRDLLAH